jgi:ABC-type multidrug transport system ATPase subunit/ABC-type multidrug transport system permease subunit
MSDEAKTVFDKVGAGIRFLTPLAYRVQRAARHLMRRAMHKPRTVAEGPNLLPHLIQVLAAFSKLNGKVLEEEIDSSLGFLRHDYPEAVYSELRKLFRQALNEQQDLMSVALKLSTELGMDRKIMLGVQLYDLISKAGGQQEQVVNYYSFMSHLGMAAQAIDIVYQLNAADHADNSIYQKGASPLESLSFGSDKSSDVMLKALGKDERLLAFRYHDLIILKNHADAPIFVRGTPLARGEFCRVFVGQRIVIGEQVLTHQDLVSYFNAKKNVALAQIYVTVGKNDEVELEKSRTRESSLEVKFGLRVQVKALKNVDAVLNGVPLRAGAYVEGTLEDKIVFRNESELPLTDLRRQARALGGRFQLKTHKSEYLVSNNPGLLEEDDILLSPGTGSDVLLKIQCDYEHKVGKLEVLQADRPILVGEMPVRNSALLADGDTIRIDTGQVLRCNFSERIIEEERNIISSLDLHDLSHRFSGGETALDGISLSVARGEMVCVMGASGCGKSTLMRVLAGQLKPMRGEVLLNGQSLYAGVENLKSYIAYIPQDDAFDELLTIEENLDLAAAIRSPHLSVRDRARRIDGKLVELGLSERRRSLVGSPIKKTLSGGERKRLNIGLDMIGSADVYLFDEPTSGLSSKDSEHVIEIIRSMSHNKIVLVTLHQPTSKLFQMFNKAMLLDKGGRLVFYGTPHEMLAYFAQAEHQQHFGTELGGCPACGTTRPEFIFDVLETPLRDLSGDIIYEENNQGQLVPARRFSPEYWRDKYESHRLIQDVRQPRILSSQPPPLVPSAPVNSRVSFRWHDEWTQLKTLLRRAFFSKMRNRANLLTTIVEAPLLAALIGGVLRYSENGHYDFASAYHIPTFLFLGLIVAMFLGLTNSADDIIRDRVILQRERNLNVRLPYYIFSKALVLGVFAAIQCVLYILIGNAILEIRGMFWIHFGFMFLTAFTGIALGLLISSLVADAKTAANIVPLVLIPQIILGGALIKYEEMNRNLDFVYTINRWLSTHSNEEKGRTESKLQVPFLCEFMPMRWSYEAVVVAQAKLNPLTRRQEKVQDQIDRLVSSSLRTEDEAARLEDLKDTLAMLSGLESWSADEIDRRFRYVDRVLAGKPLETFALRSAKNVVAAEALYVNQKISDLVSKAETEQSDYRRTDASGRRKPINVFFGPEKYLTLGIGGKTVQLECSVFVFNTLVLLGFSVGTLFLLHVSLRRQLSLPV